MQTAPLDVGSLFAFDQLNSLIKNCGQEPNSSGSTTF